VKKKMCKELSKILKNKPFFNVGGGCGVDLSNGESNCMAKDGAWFRFCPFCGKRIESYFNGNNWSWGEQK